MSETKSTSFRVNEEDVAKFKEYADKEGYSQAEAFESIMKTLELAKAKKIIKDRAKEVEVFQETINTLMGYFINSLQVNQTSEERIREEFSKELTTKDNAISTMYEQLQELKIDKSNLEAGYKEIESKNKELQEQLQKANTDNLDKQKNIDKLNSNNDLLQEQLQEYKQYKEQHKALEEQLEQLRVDNSTKDNTINNLENNVKQLRDKVNNDTDMISFYKDSNTELKINIKALEQQHKQEVQEVKEEATRVLEGQIKSITEQLQAKHDVEIAKKELEIEKLNNVIEQLKTAKTAKTPRKNKSQVTKP